MRAHIAVAVTAGLIFSSCTDETTINNYNMATSGMITGSIDPVEIGIYIYLDEFRSYRLRDDGYFYFTDVEPGEHLITVEPVTFSPRRISGVSVAPAQATNLGTIELSHLPYPIYLTQPADGDSLVRTSTYGLSLYLDEPLSLEDLASKTTISPPVAGEWAGKATTGRTGTRYDFIFNDARSGDRYSLTTSTAYTVRIDKSVRTVEGEPLETDAEIEFRTEPLTVYADISKDYENGEAPLLSFEAYLKFNDSVDVDSVTRAATFEPPIPGIWIRRTSRGDISFLMAAPSLVPSTQYKLIIRGDVPLAGSTTLSRPDTTEFMSAALGVEYISPCNGCESGSGSVLIEFNTPMDTATVNAAFTVSPVGGTPVPGTKSWTLASRILSFAPNPKLGPTAVYVIRLTTEARSSTGVHIAQGIESYFVIR
jgi:hypothetical protein